MREEFDEAGNRGLKGEGPSHGSFQGEGIGGSRDSLGARLRRYRGTEPREQRAGDVGVTLVNKII